MHDEVEVVEQNPFRPLVAFDVRGLRAALPQRLHDARRQSRGPAAGWCPDADREVIGEASRLAQIEHDDVDRPSCLRPRRSARSPAPGASRSSLGGLFSLGHATCLPPSPRARRDAPPGVSDGVKSVVFNVLLHARAPARSIVRRPRAAAGSQWMTRRRSAHRCRMNQWIAAPSPSSIGGRVMRAASGGSRCGSLVDRTARPRDDRECAASRMCG